MNILDKLAAKAKEGDTDAFSQLFDLLSSPIYKFLSFRLQNPEDAKDLTSQVFLETWQGIDRYNPNRSFKAWIFSIARYTLIDFYRSHKTTASLEAVTQLPDKTDIEAEISTKTDTEKIIAQINRLPELYQTVLTLKFLNELDYSEISQLTGKTENSLRVIVKRGLDKIRKNLDE